MRKPNNNLPADVRVILGSTGSGKSFDIKKAIAKEKNVFVFDVKNEYGDLPQFRRVHSRAGLLEAARRGGRIAWPATGAANFEYFCKVIWARGDCLVIAEELASVTGTAKAIGAWHLILSQGRGFGLRVIGLTQRPSEIDKTIIGNATLIRSHRLTRRADQKYVAGELGADLSDVAGLQNFDFIELHVPTADLRRSNGKPLKKAA